MKEVFVKKYWAEEDTLYYIHFHGRNAVSQIEIRKGSKVFLSTENPLQGDSMLYDQSLEDLDLDKNDFISQDEFMRAWNEKK
ncbi:hypothetical protein [Maribacter sp. 2-571]|uniref:hypothetical protein n=1 Tax=Maribacter sp. 2-571 TaxID=3417569 RepID=UPI003D33BA96